MFQNLGAEDDIHSPGIGITFRQICQLDRQPELIAPGFGKMRRVDAPALPSPRADRIIQAEPVAATYVEETAPRGMRQPGEAAADRPNPSALLHIQHDRTRLRALAPAVTGRSRKVEAERAASLASGQLEVARKTLRPSRVDLRNDGSERTRSAIRASPACPARPFLIRDPVNRIPRLVPVSQDSPGARDKPFETHGE